MMPIVKWNHNPDGKTYSSLNEFFMTAPIKETTYQRLKRENQELRNKLYKVITEPDTEEAILIKADIIMKAGIEKAIFAGDAGSFIQTGIKTKE